MMGITLLNAFYCPRFHLLRILVVLLMMSPPVFAKCFLPIPDGDDENYAPSKANLFGDIVKAELPFVFIKNGQTQKVEKVSVSKISEVYSVYGGIGPLLALRANMQAWIWFDNCVKPKSEVFDVAYLQFF
jgi:hypothetical protein